VKHHPLLGGCVNSTDRQPHTQTNGRNLPPNDPMQWGSNPTSQYQARVVPPGPSEVRCGPAGKSGTGLHNQSAGANFSVQNHLYPGARGRAPFSAPRVARRNLRMCFRLIRAVSTRLAHQSTRVSIWHSVPNRVGASGAGLGWPCALEGKGGPTRSSLGERGAVPAGRLDRLAFPARTHAVQMSSRGVRAAAGIDR